MIQTFSNAWYLDLFSLVYFGKELELKDLELSLVIKNFFLNSMLWYLCCREKRLLNDSFDNMYHITCFYIFVVLYEVAFRRNGRIIFQALQNWFVCLFVCLCVGGGGGVCALVIAHFRGHLCVFYNTTGDSLQLGTSPVVETSCPDSPVAKKRKNALFQPGT